MCVVTLYMDLYPCTAFFYALHQRRRWLFSRGLPMHLSTPPPNYSIPHSSRPGSPFSHGEPQSVGIPVKRALCVPHAGCKPDLFCFTFTEQFESFHQIFSKICGVWGGAPSYPCLKKRRKGAETVQWTVSAWGTLAGGSPRVGTAPCLMFSDSPNRYISL